jgi:mono/diheme cytochrome c family protein
MLEAESYQAEAAQARQHKMKRSRDLILLFWIPLLVSGANATAANSPTSEIDGRMLLQKNCSRCHSIDATGQSPLEQAPPLREIYLKYPIEQLEYGFAEGMGSKHREMPQIQFSSEQVSAILNYLGSVTGVAPSARPRSPTPSETQPP